MPVKITAPAAVTRARWTFLTNHAHVLLALVKDSSARVRDLAVAVGITERAVHHILADLEDEHVIERVRNGRRNIYRINPHVKLRHPIEAAHEVGDLITLAR